MSREVVLSLWRGPIAIRRAADRNKAEILADVAARYHLTRELMLGPSRRRYIAHPRQEAMAEMYATGRWSLPQIGLFLGGRDHTTVLYGIRAHKARLVAQSPDCRPWAA